MGSMDNERRFGTAGEAAEFAKQVRTVGSNVFFGNYPQSDDGDAGSPIEWTVLDYDAGSDRALLISRYGLDCQRFDTEIKIAPPENRPLMLLINDAVKVTWETCTLRAWLNDTFLNRAFSSGEQKAILTTNVDNSDSQHFKMWVWRAKGGNNTRDKVFLLSCGEANKYFGLGREANVKSRVAPTAYAVKQGAVADANCLTEDGSASALWLLRSPGMTLEGSASVAPDGSIAPKLADFASAAIRPAFWLDVSGL